MVNTAARINRRRRERELRKQLQKRPQEVPLRRPFLIPKKPIEYACPKCRIVVAPIDWIVQGTYIHYMYQPTTCLWCGIKLEMIKNVESPPPKKV